MQLREAMNTYNLALFEIKNMGYEISIDPSDDGLEIDAWEATKNDFAWRNIGLVRYWKTAIATRTAKRI
jgi:hypothetical protein